jgi:hypothetical protein
VREHADPHLTCILVGNKVDLCEDSGTSGHAATASGRHRQVPQEEAELWAKEEGLLFVEASAKSGRNVELAFERASRDILDKIKRGVFDDDRVSDYQRDRAHKLIYPVPRDQSHQASSCQNRRVAASRWGQQGQAAVHHNSFHGISRLAMYCYYCSCQMVVYIERI